MARVLSAHTTYQTAAAEAARTFVALALSVGCFAASGDVTQRASSRTATPLNDGQSKPVQLVSQPSNMMPALAAGCPSESEVVVAEDLTCAVISRAAKRAASAS